MLGPYSANKDGSISYKGNKIFKPMKDIFSKKVPLKEFEKRAFQFNSDKMWGHIASINHQINISANLYFKELGALFTLLPLTTKMISSPGALHGRSKIDYTQDTCPITLNWFDLPKKVFLSESSQIYLELSLMQKGVGKVYSIYNSFRKEIADATHLSEFHHIEFEGKIDQRKNEKIALGLVKRIISDLLKNNKKDLSYFLKEEKLKKLKKLMENIFNIPKITFKEALDILYKETKNDKYKEFTLKNFGAWEEIKLTEILGEIVLIKEFPLLEVPFYHEKIEGKIPSVSNNSDIIWPGYREFIGSGQRIDSIEKLRKKAEMFNLPEEDYEIYIKSRELKNYSRTSGFGFGWERFLQGILEMPFIWSASQFPRVDGGMKP